ncbi:MAG: PIN domain-containing protein [Nanoarchaeota archaeon]
MKFVVDTNILLSALLKDGLSREILTNFNFSFFTPSFALSEIIKYKKYVCKKSSLSEEQFNSTLKKIFEYVTIIPLDEYVKYTYQSDKLIHDIGDVPFLACALALNSDIWSNDKHFKKQRKVRVFTTDEFLKKFLKKIG